MKHVGKPSKSAIKRTPVKSDMPNAPTLNFEEMIDKSSPSEFKAQTVNGSARWMGTGWNTGGKAGWAAGSWIMDSEQLLVDPTHRPGRSNRTGE